MYFRSFQQNSLGYQPRQLQNSVNVLKGKLIMLLVPLLPFQYLNIANAMWISLSSSSSFLLKGRQELQPLAHAQNCQIPTRTHQLQDVSLILQIPSRLDL